VITGLTICQRFDTSEGKLKKYIVVALLVERALGTLFSYLDGIQI
jgi:hypothetical protein